MAELEIRHESEHAIDPMGQKVGVLAAILAVLLAVVTIASHRTHTEAIIEKAAANDHWQHYQASRLKYHNLVLGEDLIQLILPRTEASAAALARYGAEKEKYDKQREEIKAQADEAEAKAGSAEHRALRYDLGEGLLEIGLVLTSLYFISRKKLFPTIGLIAATAGIGIAITGLLIH